MRTHRVGLSITFHYGRDDSSRVMTGKGGNRCSNKLEHRFFSFTDFPSWGRKIYFFWYQHDAWKIFFLFAASVFTQFHLRKLYKPETLQESNRNIDKRNSTTFFSVSHILNESRTVKSVKRKKLAYSKGTKNWPLYNSCDYFVILLERNQSIRPPHRESICAGTPSINRRQLIFVAA